MQTMLVMLLAASLIVSGVALLRVFSLRMLANRLRSDFAESLKEKETLSRDRERLLRRLSAAEDAARLREIMARREDGVHGNLAHLERCFAAGLEWHEILDIPKGSPPGTIERALLTNLDRYRKTTGRNLKKREALRRAHDEGIGLREAP